MYSLETLQYQQLLELFVRHCRTPLGADRFAEITPHTSRLALKRDLDAVAEGLFLSKEDAGWYFSELADPTDSIAILKISNASIEPGRLLELSKMLSQALEAKRAISEYREAAPTLYGFVEDLPSSLSDLAAKIKKKILPTGEVDDSASPELARIRREINSMRGRLTKSLETFIRKKGSAIQDDIVTIRNERFVIPVKADFSGKINGVAHGTSSSGATIFIEPLESIEANNELQKYKSKEESEISRILFSLADDARDNLDGIRKAAAVVGELDFVKAKMLFSKKFGAIIPDVSDDQTLEFVAARHPLLEESLLRPEVQSAVNETAGRQSDQVSNLEPGSEIVPSSFSLSQKKSVMVISGANAGGKTVVLKTAGLLSLMAVSGLPVPAQRARVPFYASILADIGDHQSLASNLSTFSSHVANIASMMDDLQGPALILLDEVGTGTDPDEGSALGVAIVDHFRKQGAQIIASTHYKGLKIYAAGDEDVINASVEFDEKTLQPTYKLLTGLAGASSGLEIARRFGIRDEVIKNARENLDEAARKTEVYLRELQDETKRASDLRIALEEEREATAEKYSRLDIDFGKKERERNAKFENEIEKVINGFEHEARQILKSVKDVKQKKKLEKDVAAARGQLRRKTEEVVSSIIEPGGTRAKKRNAKKASAPAIRQTDAPVEKGSKVLLKQFGNVGRVEKLEGDTAYVLVGSVRMKQNVSDLQSVAESVPKKKAASVNTKHSSGESLDTKIDNQSISQELNLIGMTTLEAEDDVDKFLDDSYASKIMRVRIIHGHGTGALRNAVHGYLKNHPHVESFGFAAQNEGGHGATVVELKK
jgi:DNA mismatch repair protein MutS2